LLKFLAYQGKAIKANGDANANKGIRSEDRDCVVRALKYDAGFGL